MGRGGVDIAIGLVEAARLYLGRLLLVVDDRQIPINQVDAGLSNDDTVRERGMPLDPTHLRDTQLVKDSFGAEVVQEESVVGADEDFSEGGREDALNLGEAFLDDGPFARVAAVKAAHEHLTSVAVKRADAVFADEAAAERVFTTFL